MSQSVLCLFRKVVEIRSSYTTDTSMTDVKRSHGLGTLTLTNVKHLIMTRSAKVRDICMVNAKKKQLANAIEPEVLEQNNSNSIKEQQNQYENCDMFQTKIDGAGDRRIREWMDSGKVGRTLGSKTSKTDRKLDTRLIDSESKSLVTGAGQRVKPNIYVAVPRGPVKRNTDPLPEVKQSRKTSENVQRAEPKRKPRSIGSDRLQGRTDLNHRPQTELNHRPQTPKVKKSAEMRNQLKLLVPSNTATRDIDEFKTPTNQSTPEIETPETILRAPQSRMRSTTSTRLQIPNQLLHPLWRRIPHRVLYGWSEQHQQLEEALQNQIAKQLINSMYYREDGDYQCAQVTSGGRFLAKPLVSNVEDVISLLSFYDKHPTALPSTTPMRKSTAGDSSAVEDVESGYDGDDE